MRMNLWPLDSIPVCSAIASFSFILCPFKLSLHMNVGFFIDSTKFSSKDVANLIREVSSYFLFFASASSSFFVLSRHTSTTMANFFSMENFSLSLKFINSLIFLKYSFSRLALTLSWVIYSRGLPTCIIASTSCDIRLKYILP